jgi:hypothetical protein
LKLLEWLDPDNSGQIVWHEFLRGGKSPYFFNGYEHFSVRKFFQENWQSVLSSCRANELGGSGSESTGCLAHPEFVKILRELFSNGLQFPIDKSMFWLRLEEITKNYMKKSKQSEDLVVLDYIGLIEHFAGDLALAENIVCQRWETIWTLLGSKWGVIRREELEEVLLLPEVLQKRFLFAAFATSLISHAFWSQFGLTPSMISSALDTLPKRESKSLNSPKSVDIQEFCWKAAKYDIFAKIMSKGV